MTNRSMMEIHVDSLAFAAGVTPPAHLAVSHAPAITRPPRRRLRRGLRYLLTAMAGLLNRAATALDASQTEEYDRKKMQTSGKRVNCNSLNFGDTCSTPT